MYKKHHLILAKEYWKNFLKKGFIAIDATAGNGHDSLFLSKCLVENLNGKLYCFDIQKKAITNTSSLLKENLSKEILDKIILFQASHEDFSKYIKTKVNLVIYNLGYLPKSDKKITTNKTTTVRSIKSAISILDQNGAISIVSYPGHAKGKEEEKSLLYYLKKLSYDKFNICYHKWLNKEKAPSFFWIEKR